MLACIVEWNTDIGIKIIYNTPMPAEAHSTFFYGYRNKKRMVAVNEKGTLHFIKTIRILHVFTHLK
jgi:hypothetical protein